MNSNNKQIRDVADVAARIMAGLPVTEKLHPNQQVLDVHEPEKDELTADDFKKLRAKKGGVVKEDDTGYQDRFAVKNGKAVKHNPEKGEHDEPHHVWADSPEHAVRKHATMNKPKTEEVAEGFKFNSHERGAAERLKDMRKNEKEAEKMDKQYSAMRKKREQDKLKKEEVEQMVQEREDDEYHTPSKHHVQVQVSKGDGQKTYRKATVRAKEPKHAVSAAIAHYKQQGYTVHDHKYLGEDVEQMDEVKMADLPSTKVQGRAYGASKPEPHALDLTKGPKDKELKNIDAEKKKKFSEMVGTYKNAGLKSFMESLSKEEEEKIIDEVSKEIADYTMNIIDAGEYTEVTIGEEASQEEFNAEIEKAKAKSQGKIKAEVAKAAVQAVKQEETEITDEMIFEVLENAGIDFESLSDNELQEVANEAYEILDELSKDTLKSYRVKSIGRAGNFEKRGYEAGKKGGGAGSDKADQLFNKSDLVAAARKRAQEKMRKEEVELGEDRMNDAEMEKREKIVKGMKKGLSGFKERYGARAKNVMYATATKRAMEK
jgi:hypothetical protein